MPKCVPPRHPSLHLHQTPKCPSLIISIKWLLLNTPHKCAPRYASHNASKSGPILTSAPQWVRYSKITIIWSLQRMQLHHELPCLIISKALVSLLVLAMSAITSSHLQTYECLIGCSSNQCPSCSWWTTSHQSIYKRYPCSPCPWLWLPMCSSKWTQLNSHHHHVSTCRSEVPSVTSTSII